MEWGLEKKHSVYGKVIMVKTIEGEPYRWLIKNSVVSMIPLSVLKIKEKRRKRNEN